MNRFQTTFIIFALAAVAPGCRAKGRDMPTNVVALGKELQVKLPASARVIVVERENGMDDLVQAKLEMAERDLPGFLASTPIQPDAFRPGTEGFLGQDHGFWNPHQGCAIRTAQAWLPEARALNIGVCPAVNGSVIVYIVNHGT